MRNFCFGRCACFFLSLTIPSLFVILFSRGAAGFDSSMPRKKVRFDQGNGSRVRKVLENLDFSDNKEVPKDFFRGKLKEDQTHATSTTPCANQPDILQKAALPDELLFKIAGSSKPEDLPAFALSSKQFNQMANNPVLWKKYLEVFAPALWKKEKTTQGVSPKELEQRRAQLNFQRATELKILQQLIKKHGMLEHPYFQQTMDRTSSSEH